MSQPTGSIRLPLARFMSLCARMRLPAKRFSSVLTFWTKRRSSAHRLPSLPEATLLLMALWPNCASVSAAIVRLKKSSSRLPAMRVAHRAYDDLATHQHSANYLVDCSPLPAPPTQSMAERPFPAQEKRCPCTYGRTTTLRQSDQIASAFTFQQFHSARHGLQCIRHRFKRVGQTLEDVTQSHALFRQNSGQQRYPNRTRCARQHTSPPPSR